MTTQIVRNVVLLCFPHTQTEIDISQNNTLNMWDVLRYFLYHFFPIIFYSKNASLKTHKIDFISHVGSHFKFENRCSKTHLFI